MNQLNLGLESMNLNKCDEFITDVEISEESLNIYNDLQDLRDMLRAYDAVIGVINTVKTHGCYAGFESLFADKAELDQIIGFDICTASQEQIELMISDENIADSLNKFGAKLSTVLGRIGDRISNFIKTTLPFKEKYLQEMTDLKSHLSGKKIDDEKFATKRIGSALSKSHYNDFVQKHNDLLKALHDAAKQSTDDKIDDLIRKMEEHPEVVRGWFITYVKTPWLSWFTKDTVKGLGYTGKDVIPVLDKAIDAIKNIEELRTTYAKINEQFNRLETQISQDRAVGAVVAAIEKRKQVSNLQNFFYTMCEAAGVYDTTTRRLMYFATYLGRAAKDCIID